MTAHIIQPLPRVPLYRQLYIQVIVASVIGILVGYFYPKTGIALAPLGDAFIKAIRMIIAPVIFCSVVHGIASMGDMKRVGRVALKTLVYFEVVTSLALVIGLVGVNLLRPGAGMNIDVSKLDLASVKAYTSVGLTGPIPFLLGLIPNTAVSAFADGNILQVLVFSVLFAFGLTMVGPAGKPVVNFIEIISQILFKIVGLIMQVPPVAAFGALAFTVGRFGTASLFSLLKLILEFYAIAFIFIIVVLGSISRLAGFSVFKLMRYIREELVIGLATTSSETVLPQLMGKLEAAGCDESVVALVIPTGYSFNLDGACLYLAVTAVFLAEATNTPLDLLHQLGLLAILLLTSKGSAGVAGAAFVILAATISATGSIPIGAVALVLGIHRFMAEAITFTNLVGNGVATIVISKWEGVLDTARLRSILENDRAGNMIDQPLKQAD